MEDRLFCQGSALLATKMLRSYLVAQIHTQVHNIYLYPFHCEHFPVTLTLHTQGQSFSVSTFHPCLFATFAATADVALNVIMTVQMHIQTRDFMFGGQETEATTEGWAASQCLPSKTCAPNDPNNNEKDK